MAKKISRTMTASEFVAESLELMALKSTREQAEVFHAAAAEYRKIQDERVVEVFDPQTENL